MIEQIAYSEITYLQVIDENGSVDSEHEPKLSESELVKLYRFMVLAREADQRALKMQRQGRVGTFAPSSGQEAVCCGTVMAMQDSDWFVNAYRELGGRLMRGESLSNSLLLWNGFEEGNFMKAEKRTLPITVVLASQLPIAVGLAYAMRLKGESDTAVVTIFGDGASSEGDTHEAMNFASVWKVPVVFICQNNHWAISTPLEKQTNSRTFAQRAVAYDMPGKKVDGNDALAVYSAVKEALDHAKNGGGPSLIECETYRIEMHTTADDPTKYRPDDEVELWKKRDPLIRFRKYMEQKGIWDSQKQELLEVEIKSDIDTAIVEFESMTEFKPDAPFDYVFGTKNDEIEEQRSEFLKELRKEKQNG